MAKKEKSSVDKVVKKVNKLLDEIEKLRGREMKRFSAELERRMNDFSEIQQNILERVGMASGDKESGKESSAKSAPGKGSTASATGKASKARKSSSNSKPSVKKGSTKKNSAKKQPASNAAASQTSAVGATQAAATTKAKAVDENDVTRIKGVGPVTAEKMRAAGITSIRQIAEPSEDDHLKLQEFYKMRGFQSWQVEAKKLLP
jgi:predicted flap endonuclease-1-like 5' DNA nuclease